MATRKERRPVDGVILIDKNAGVSSNGVLSRLKRLFNAKKAGHTGTLDPFATGLLPVAFGEATKFSSHLLDSDKTYEARIRLGVATETGDTEGAVTETIETGAFTDNEIAGALSAFTGDIRQVPPMFSALKRNGKALYEYAREGIVLERESRPVTVHSLEATSYEHPFLTVKVSCSKGTYVRTLAEDIGRYLGTCAHLDALRRTETGGFGIESAYTVEELEADPQRAQTLLKRSDYLIRTLPEILVTEAVRERFLNGQRISLEKEGIGMPADPAGLFRVVSGEGIFAGTAEIKDGVLHPVRVTGKNAAV